MSAVCGSARHYSAQALPPPRCGPHHQAEDQQLMANAPASPERGGPCNMKKTIRTMARCANSQERKGDVHVCVSDLSLLALAIKLSISGQVCLPKMYFGSF